MPFNGAGTFVPPSSTFNPAVPATDIDASDWNALLADLATGLSTTITKDGQTTPTANIPLGGFKLTGVGSPSTSGDALIYGTTAANAVLINSGKPCFLAYNGSSQANQTGSGAGAAPAFGTEVFDRGSNFSSGIFTAPVTGIYRLTSNVLLSLLSSTMVLQVINMNTSNQVFTSQQEFVPAGTGTLALKIDVLADMDAGDMASVSVQLSGGAGNTASIFGQAASPRYTFFCGELVA